MIQAVLPIRTCSEPNARGHWAKRARRARTQREAARLVVQAAIAKAAAGNVVAQPLTIRLCRIAPRALDSDNLAAALKAVRDGVADALGLDDGNPRLVWLYDQRKGKPREYAATVQIQ